MTDILIARGKHRATIIPDSKVGLDWIWGNFAPADILATNAVMINIEYVEDIIGNLEGDDIAYEFR